MSVKVIPRASTYGQKNEWQTAMRFLEQIRDEYRIRKNDDLAPSLEDIDEIVSILIDNRFCISGHCGAARLVEDKDNKPLTHIEILRKVQETHDELIQKGGSSD